MSEPTNRKKGGERLAPKGDTPSGTRRTRRPDHRSRQQKIRDRLLIVATVVAAIIVVVFIGAKLFFVKPEVEQKPTPPVSSGHLTTETDQPDTTPAGRKKDFFTFLVIGRDTGGGGNTDTILLAAYDVPNQKLNVMSIPRDTMVNVSWDIKRINSVYNVYGGDEKGIDALDDEISQLVGFRPDFQVVVEWKAVGELVDALGGVYYDVPRNMQYWDPTQDLRIDVKKGYQKLDGDLAMQVVRFREGKNGYANGDLGRIETQQGFLKAVVGQCLKIENMTRVGELAKVFNENVTTNLSINNLAWFAQQAIFGGLNMENVNFVTMPCTGANVWSREYKNKQSYVVPDTDELVALVNECFNPYLEELDSKDLDIMYVSGDGTIGSSTGKLEDQKANAAWLAVKNTPKATPTPSVAPSESPEVTESPEVSQSPAPSATPKPSGTPKPSTTPAPSSTPAPTPTPEATLPPAPTPAPTPEPTPNPNGPPEGIPIL